MAKTILCQKCEGFIFGLLNELRNNAKVHKRGNMIMDSIDDLQESLEDGNIQRVKTRDDTRCSGISVPRKLKSKKKK